MTIQKAPTNNAGPTNQHATIDRVAYRYNQPVLFYTLSTVITWVFWFMAASLSQRPEQTDSVRLWTAILGLTGLAAPTAVAWWLIRHKPDLLSDVKKRLLWPRGVNPFYLACAVLIPLLSLLAAQTLSLLFGYSTEQFQFRGGFSFTSGLLPVWVILGLAPVLEELAWHSYGTDALLTRMRLFTASLVFTVIWTLWHVPLAFIQGYYQAEVVAEGWLHALNFPLSMVGFVLVMNWLYYRTGRSITVAIVYHAASNYFNEIFLTHPDSKLIQTALLLIVAAVVVWRDRELFFHLPPRPEKQDGAE